jgi:hypothetical protein
MAGAAVVVIPLSLLGLHASAQQTEKQRGNVDEARQLTMLMKQGQLNLRDATEIAERHLKGTALEAVANLQPAGRPGAENPDAQRGQLAGNKLVYTISLFASEEVKTIRVDGLTKKVIEE